MDPVKQYGYQPVICQSSSTTTRDKAHCRRFQAFESHDAAEYNFPIDKASQVDLLLSCLYLKSQSARWRLQTGADYYQVGRIKDKQDTSPQAGIALGKVAEAEYSGN
jgi:hypothetical protein